MALLPAYDYDPFGGVVLRLGDDPRLAGGLFLLECWHGDLGSGFGCPLIYATYLCIRQVVVVGIVENGYSR